MQIQIACVGFLFFQWRPFLKNHALRWESPHLMSMSIYFDFKVNVYIREKSQMNVSLMIAWWKRQHMVTHRMLLTVKFNSLSSDKIWKQALLIKFVKCNNPVKLLTRKFAWKSTKLLLQDAISRSGFIWIFQSCLNLKKKCFPPNNQVVAISITKKT